MSRAILVDGNSLCKRSIMNSAMSDFKAGGVYTGGVYGSWSSLARIVRSLSAQFTVGPVLTFFDAGVPAARKKFIPEYKANREKKRMMMEPAEMEKAMSQMDMCKQLFRALGTGAYARQDFEADDLVATAVKHFENPIVISSDHDLFQCAGHGASIYNLGAKSEELITAANFEQLVGVPLNSFLLSRALEGETSDNIKGLAGCGEKTAKQWAQRAAIFCNEDDNPHVRLEKLVKSFRSKQVLKAVEQRLIDDYRSIDNILRGIDLFRPEYFDDQLFDAVRHRDPFDGTAATRLALKWKLMTMSTAYDQYVEPFDLPAWLLAAKPKPKISLLRSV